jgi:cobalt/nickel transport system permease protein
MMAGIHMLIGVGEGLITALILVAIAKARPELVLEDPAAPRTATSYFAIAAYGLLITLGLALFLSPFASQLPDGLEKVAETLGIAHRATTHPAPMADYRIPLLDRLGNTTVSTSLAGAIGAILIFALSWLLAHALVPRKAPAAANQP